MAKRRKTVHRTKRHHARRRSVSGVKDLDFTVIALAIGGAVASRILTTKLAASTSATMQKFAPYAGLGIGIILPIVTKNPMIKALSIGMVAGGGVEAIGPTGLKMISGFENTIAGSVGYPYNVLPYRAKVAGIEEPDGYISKPNFSGSGKTQMNVISGINSNGSGDGSAFY